MDLTQRLRSFSPFAVVSAGLIDGINPCAFTVIVFFISFLALQGYRKRELIAIGLSFIFSVFLTYLLIGLGLFGFLYRLEAFWHISRIVNVSIGIFSIILGVLCVYDFLKFRQTAKTEGLILQLPAAVKKQIHSIIGLTYRKSRQQGDSASRVSVSRLILSALVTGFLVSILEAVCTGQVYLPTITLILKANGMNLQALAYLTLYNLMFILPLFIIFILALEGVSSEQFAHFLKKHLVLIKLFMAVLFFALGAFLIISYLPKKTAIITKPVISSGQSAAGIYAWDFGTVREGEVSSHDFIFKNETGKVLNIKDTRTSCGCTGS